MRRPLRALGPLLLALFVAVTVQSLVPSSVNAQQQEEDVVYLKDGSILRGTVIEDVIGESLRIRTRDGNVFRIAYDRIERRTKEPAVVADPTQAAPTQAQPRAPVMVGRKSPLAAFALSLFITGAGQGYNGQWGKGGLMFLGSVTSIAVAINNAPDCADYEECGAFSAGMIGWVGFMLWSWIDAPVSASAINRRLEAGIALEIGPQPRMGFPSDALARSLSHRPVGPQFGVSLARLSF